MINDHYNVDRLHVSRLQVARERMVLRTSLELLLYVLYVLRHLLTEVTEYRDDDEIVLKILEVCFELKCFKLIHYHFV